MMKWLLPLLLFSNLVLASGEPALSEDQIPLKIETQSKAANSQSEGTKLVFTLAILAGVFGASYYFLRRYSFKNNNSVAQTQIKVLSQHYLGPKKSLAIVRVAGESILIGVTDQNINMIKSLSLLDEDLPQVVPKDFQESLTENADIIAEVDQIEDEFSFAGLKTTVSQKLRSMRNLQ